VQEHFVDKGIQLRCGFTLYPERWQERRQFFEQVAEAIDEDARLRLVFAMREEYLASFEAYSVEINDRLKARFRLERLRRDAALDAVRKPLSRFQVTFRPGVDEKLVDRLMKVVGGPDPVTRFEEFAEPLQLQLVCRQLWRNLPPGTREIDDSAVANFGEIEDALQTYYETTIDAIAKRCGTSRGRLRLWVEQNLITEDGKRSFVFRGLETTKDLDNDVVDAIEKDYLIRSEPRGESVWYELSHDRFIRPILRSNRAWRRERDIGGRAASLEAKAASWKKAAATGVGMADVYALGSEELREAREWLASSEAKDMALSATVHEFVEWCEDLRQQATNRALRVRFLVAALLAIVSIVGAFFVMKANYAASVATEKAKVEKAKTQIEIAATLMADGHGIDALALSSSAASSGLLPKDSANSMRAALKLVGGADWYGRANAPMTGMAVSSSGKKMVTVSPSEICFWDLVKGSLLQPCKAPPRMTGSQQSATWIGANISAGGRWVVGTAASTEGSSSFGMLTRRDVTRIVYRTDPGDESSMNAALRDATTRISAQAALSLKAPGRAGGPTGPSPRPDPNWISFSPDERTVLVTNTSLSPNTYLYDSHSGKYRCTIPLLAGVGLPYVTQAGVAVVTEEQGWHLWSPECRSIAVLKTKEHRPRFSSVGDDNDGRLLAIAGFLTNSVRLFDLQTLHERDPLLLPAGEPGGAFPRIMLSPDDGRLVVFGAGRLMVFDVLSGRLTAPPSFRPGAFLGPLIVSAHTDGGVTKLDILNVFSGQKESRRIQTSEPDSFAGDREGRRLAILYGGVVRVFDREAPVKDYDKMSVSDLSREACYELRNQSERGRTTCR